MEERGIPFEAIPKETIIIGHKKRGKKWVPIIKAFLHEGRAIFWCVWCVSFHSHEPDEGFRVSQCYSPDSPLYKTEYYIKVVTSIAQIYPPPIILRELEGKTAKVPKDLAKMIGKTVRVRYVKEGEEKITFAGEGQILFARCYFYTLMPDGKVYLLPLPQHEGDRIEVFEDGEWKVWREIPAKRPLKIAKGATILLPK